MTSDERATAPASAPGDPRTDEPPPYRFDWHTTEPDGFLRWVIPVLLAGADRELVERLGRATGGWREVDLAIRVNGVDLPTRHLVEQLESNLDHRAARAARDLVAELIDVGRVRAELDSLARAVEAHVADAAWRLGVELAREEDRW